MIIIMKKAALTEEEELIPLLIQNIGIQMSRRNWSIKMLSDRADLPYETLKKLLSYKIRRPSLITVVKIASAFECPIDRLLGQEPPALDSWRQLVEKNEELGALLTDMEHFLY